MSDHDAADDRPDHDDPADAGLEDVLAGAAWDEPPDARGPHGGLGRIRALPAGPLFLGTGALVVVALVVGIVLVDRAAPALRGAATAPAAATAYVGAVDDGDADRAVAVSCDLFADEARAMARTGSDAGIEYRLGAVSTTSNASARAVLTEVLHLPGSVQRRTGRLTLVVSDGRWLVCGHR